MLFQLANCLQETIYPDVKSVDRAMSECLYYVRNQDDIEDEEEDGGLQRPWLSCFELVKSFTASPSLNFLSWLDLWFSLPNMEKGERTSYVTNNLAAVFFVFLQLTHP